MNRAYVVWSLGAIALYLAAGLTGWRMRSEPPQVLPADVRQAPGGYRSFHFWHSGWQGGK